VRKAIFVAAIVFGALATGQSGAQGLGTRVGTIIALGAKFCPPGWMQANGQAISIAEYQQLFFVIGTSYGGDGQHTFGLPNLKGGTIGPAAQPVTWCIAVQGEMPMKKPEPK
jgi:microcystin-dependent protein